MFSSAQLLEAARRSPAAVAAHDRAAWLALFSDDAEVHDPVGSRAHAGQAALGRFYDTFIAPNQIRFEVEHDLVCGDSVVRDLVISTAMGGTSLRVDVPLFIRYEFIAQAGQPRIRRLYAHWELATMLREGVFAQGLSQGLLAMLRLSRNMLAQQGLSGALGFSAAFAGVGRSAKRHCDAVLQQLTQGKLPDALAHSQLQWGLEACDVQTLAQSLQGARWDKMLAGGRQVSARLSGRWGHAVAVFELPDSQRDIRALRIYIEQA